MDIMMMMIMMMISRVIFFVAKENRALRADEKRFLKIFLFLTQRNWYRQKKNILYEAQVHRILFVADAKRRSLCVYLTKMNQSIYILQLKILLYEYESK